MKLNFPKLNKNFKTGDVVLCNLGLNKGKKFIINAVLKDSYSCTLADGSSDKVYGYNDQWLEEAK